MLRRFVIILIFVLTFLHNPFVSEAGIYFPPPGEGLAMQDQRTPVEVGLADTIISDLIGSASRWALWRHGYLIHVAGDFNTITEVKSLRKTWHALIVGAAIYQNRIPSYEQRINIWEPSLYGNDALATWWHVITQSSGFDYPYGTYPDYLPGEMWTYSDKNPKVLCDSLARVYGKQDASDDYFDVVKTAYFDAIGMSGWATSLNADGIRFHFDLEDMGRLGLLVLARGRWNGETVIPACFVQELEIKQTFGMLVNYNGPDDGYIDLDPSEFPESPYGFMTWVNTDGDYYPGAHPSWAWGAGAGGSYVLWNSVFGIVFCAIGADTGTTSWGIPHIIETNITGPNPLIGQDLGFLGSYSKWAPIEIEMTGPASMGTGTPNPFSFLVEVTFTGPNKETFTVPGFYDGDGNGGLDGSIWKVRFSANDVGEWNFVSSSTIASLNGYIGSFEIVNQSLNAPGFFKWGKLEYEGTQLNKIRYLKFRDGPFWLKAGCDDPENFLGSFSHYDTLIERENAVMYLASHGINSMYIMTHNIDGDGNDVWPWLGATTSEAKVNGGNNARFDIVKLAQWRELFVFMQEQGVVPYLILEDDSAWTGYDHERYYREIIARFGDLPGIIFNIGEEYNENYTLSAALSLAQILSDIDPYNHPIGIHNVNTPQPLYIDAQQINLTAIQTSFSDPLEHNQRAIDWINACLNQGKRIVMVGFDEPRPLMDRRGWWSGYMGGAVWEVHTDQPYNRPMSTWETAWVEIGGTRAFMESLPFWTMIPNNDLVISGNAFCLASPGEAYALYLPTGGTVAVDLTQDSLYEYAWWNPANSYYGSFQDSGIIDGGPQTLLSPAPGDWALRIKRVQALPALNATAVVLLLLGLLFFLKSNIRSH